MKSPIPLLSFRFCITALSTVLVSMSAWSADRAEYSIAELKPLPGWTMLLPWKINDAGEVIGRAIDSLDQGHNFIYQNGELRDFNADAEGSPLDINNLGQVLCYVGEVWEKAVPVVLGPNGASVNLGQRIGPGFRPTMINDVGDVLGYNYDDITIYNINTGASRILQDSRHPDLHDLNNRGEVVADYHPLETNFVNGVLFDGAGREDLIYPGQAFTEPLFINNRGQIVGIAATPPDDSVWRALTFIFHNGEFRAIGPLPGDQETAPAGVNDHGDVIGVSINEYGGIIRPYLYRNHKMTDLNTLIPARSGWILDEPLSINNNGQIVGTGRFEGEQRGFLLTPIIGRAHGKPQVEK